MRLLFEANRRRVLVVCAVALAARVAVFALGPLQDSRRALLEDSTHYVTLARSLVEHGEFGVPLSRQIPMSRTIAELQHRLSADSRDAGAYLPETFRTPGYPSFLAVASLGLLDLRPAIALQCLLGALSAAMVLLLVLRLGLSAKAASVVAFTWALHPALVAYDNLVLTEGLFNFMVLAAACAAASGHPAALAISGGTLGLAALVRPPLGLFYLPMMLALAWRRGARAPAVAVALACAAVPPALWTVRNTIVGEGVRFSTVADMSLIFYTAPCAVSESRGEECDRAYPRRHAEIVQRLESQLRPGDDVLAVARREAIADLAANGAGVAKMYAKSLVKLGVSHSMGTLASVIGADYRPSGLFSRLVLGERSRQESAGMGVTLLALAWTLFNAAIVAVALVGLLVAAGQRRFDLILGFAVTASLFTAGVGAVGQERIRLPMMLPLLMLCAVALTSWPSRYLSPTTVLATYGPERLSQRRLRFGAGSSSSNNKD